MACNRFLNFFDRLIENRIFKNIHSKGCWCRFLLISEISFPTCFLCESLQILFLGYPTDLWSCDIQEGEVFVCYGLFKIK